MTMHSFGTVEFPAIIATRAPIDAVLCFCYGEIDCRFRVFDNPPWEKTIDTLVEQYINVVDENAKINPNIWLFNVPPPPRRDHLPNPTGLDDKFPFHGSDAERLSYVARMNDRLKESKYPFVDIYDKYCDEDGFLNMNMSDGYLHLANEKPLMEYLDIKLKEFGR